MLGVGEIVLFFYDQLWNIHELVRNTFFLHDECNSNYPNLRMYTHSSHILAHWSSPWEDTLKLNVDGSFLQGFGCLGVGGIVRNHDKDWISRFSYYEVWGDLLLVELGVIHMSLDFCHNKGYNYIIFDSNCLKAVELFVVGCHHTLYPYATHIIHILEMLYIEMVTLHWDMFLENKNMCANLISKKGSHSRYSAHWNCSCLTWRISSWEINLKLDFFFTFLFCFVLLLCKTRKKPTTTKQTCELILVNSLVIKPNLFENMI